MEVTTTAPLVEAVPATEDLSISVKRAWGYLGIYSLFSMLGAGLVALLALPSLELIEIESSLFMFLAYVMPFLGFALYLKRKRKLSVIFLPETNQKRVPISLYLLIPPIIVTSGIILDPLLSLLPLPDFLRKMVQDDMSRGGWLVSLTVVVAAPVLEELLLRGLLLRGMLKTSGAGKAIIWSSIMFAVLHLNFYQGVGSFVHGLFLGWIFYKTRSLWPCVFFHFTNNLVSTIVPYLLPKNVDPFASLYVLIGNATTFCVVYSLAVILFVTCAFLMKRLLSDATRVGEEDALIYS
ncbi:CPBP family intramembrane glutamic endopeptidase [Pontibacter silvestris]|uniref:CPBP family intramembrane glutamic endopeptidase n=1 Tax=Pontibacter silvestris TaxID=2305183 RepID=A0ABW4WSU5_9BACT|nr:CPBP family intramembrane glutamic endopeptidase [Pontibacter silvestris]MCC9136231.1 CPBP family intramembrane metalloprotease [Pontibacter silvestris]